MLKNNSYKSIYRNLFDDFNKEFLIPSYRESNLALRASGFFSLESLIISSEGIFDFIKRKGKLKIVCSPLLSEKDINRIKSGEKINENDVTECLLKAIDNGASEMDETKSLKLDLICNLIASDIIELRIAFTPDGIYHEKFGLFLDENDDCVYFNGSFNSTENGLMNNAESFMVYKSWDGQKETIKHELQYFNDLWDGKLDKVITLSFPETAKMSLFEKYKTNDSLDDSIFDFLMTMTGKKTKKLWGFQERAIQEFVDNGFSHFYEMATGTGKTFTTIRTIKNI